MVNEEQEPGYWATFKQPANHWQVECTFQIVADTAGLSSRIPKSNDRSEIAYGGSLFDKVKNTWASKHLKFPL